ncbi:MAG: ribonuclease P protein component [Spirochaetaceae bacterium]|jgi:ribonuclease P protein component|nr:ribonuclease P protein component [Spirochaetaceae bacterium]
MSGSPTEPAGASGPRRVFPRTERLKKRADIRAAMKKGRCVTEYGAKLFYIRNNLSYNRIAFTFARKFGNAVERNRARRLGRESYRYMRAGLSVGWDFVLLVYPGERTGGATFERRFRQLKALVNRAGLGIGQMKTERA